jgi:hypothetical protein
MLLLEVPIGVVILYKFARYGSCKAVIDFVES